MSEDLVTRLRAAIEERRAVAEAATQGEWIPEGNIYVGHPTNVIVDWVHQEEDQAHIVDNQPSVVRRRCQADLTELARHTPRPNSGNCPVCVTGAHWVDEGSDSDGNEYGHDELDYEASPCGFVRYLAQAYGITEEDA
ncbi:DUF6221 family protein [Streptosporangium sp. NPDC004631]